MSRKRFWKLRRGSKDQGAHSRGRGAGSGVWRLWEWAVRVKEKFIDVKEAVTEGAEGGCGG